MVNIKVLKALRGDCLLLSFQDENVCRHILIDGGEGPVGLRQLKQEIKSIQEKNEVIDLLILTHYDTDHIANVLRLFEEKILNESLVNEVWFNFGQGLADKIGVDECKDAYIRERDSKISYRQGVEFYKFLKQNNIVQNAYVKAGDQYVIGNIVITVLSPDLPTLATLPRFEFKDYKTVKLAGKYSDFYSIEEFANKSYDGNVTLVNRSSIAVLIEFNKKKMIFLADSDPQIVCKSLEESGKLIDGKIAIDICKIAHHASRHNTDDQITKIVKCKKYIVSSSQTNTRPHKECLSRIIYNSLFPVSFYCNYDKNYLEKMFSGEEYEKYKMSFYQIDNEGIEI